MRERLRLATWPLHYALFALFSSAWLLAYGGVGCSASASDGGPMVVEPASGGSAGQGSVTIKFVDAPVELTPREQRSLEVAIAPPMTYHVRFALLGPDSTGTAPDDAALDHDALETDSRGTATVVLTAPSAPTEFTLRAQVGTTVATLPVTMSSTARVKLVLLPQYAGHRAFNSYTATAYLDASCDEIAPDMAPNAALLVRSTLDVPLELVDVPAAAKLAVVVTAGGVARGCATVEAPLPDADTEVSVELSDLPLNLEATKLDALLDLDAKDTAFPGELAAASIVVTDAVRNEADSDLAALLDALSSGLSSSRRTAFDDARAEAEWDRTLLPGRENMLSEAIERWSRQARPALFARLLEARLQKDDERGAAPSFTVSRFGGASAADSALTVTPGSWAADSSDTLALSVSLAWPPSALLTAVVAGPAQAETGLQDVPAALADLIDCDALATAMTNGPGEKELAFARQCDADCVAARCASALATMWERARDASGATRAQLLLQVSGAATLGDKAQAVALNGSWVGRLQHGDEDTSQTGGEFSAFATRD